MAVREIAGYPARLQTYSDGQPRSQPPHSIEIYTVDDPASVIDGSALLRRESTEEPPYWALIWIGARAIAARLLDCSLPAGTSVLDLGCGLGLSGIAAAKAGGQVTFVDHLEEPLEFVRASLAHEALEATAVTRADFTTDSLGLRFDIILAADIVYDPADYRALVDFLDSHLQASGTILLTETLRADARRVIEMLGGCGMKVATEAIWIDEDGRRERTWLHTLVRGATGSK